VFLVVIHKLSIRECSDSGGESMRRLGNLLAIFALKRLRNTRSDRCPIIYAYLKMELADRKLICLVVVRSHPIR